MSEKIVSWKAGADRYAQYYGDVRRALTTEFAADNRWIIASLSALNAGGLVSLASKASLCIAQELAGLSFWCGILFAFCYVKYSQFVTKRFLLIIQRIEECWVITAATGEPNKSLLAKLEREKQQASLKWSDYLAIGSFAMFSVGLCFLAVSK
jgi:hypothetical protein